MYEAHSTDIRVFSTQLNHDGFAVIPILTKTELDDYRKAFLKTLENFPEYKQTKEVKEESQYSKTGFGALAVASSFHNPFVRYLRLLLYQRLSAIFETFDSICEKGVKSDAETGKISGSCNRSTVPRKFHEIMDRMLIRVKGQAPGAESWHQDMSFAVNEDTIFGGWLAFDDQRFSLISGSHTNDICNKKGGFAAIKKGSPLYENCEKNRNIRNIPAGSILIMNQIIVHEVVPMKTKTKMLRLFTGWRLTLDKDDLLKKTMRNRNSRQDSVGSAQNISDVLRDQMLPKIPSNQLPSLYNLRTIDYPKQQQGLNIWIQKYIKEEYISMNNDLRLFKGTDNVKYPYGLPEIHMPSLHAINKKYVEYNDIEEFILKPQTFNDLKNASIQITAGIQMLHSAL